MSKVKKLTADDICINIPSGRVGEKFCLARWLDKLYGNLIMGATPSKSYKLYKMIWKKLEIKTNRTYFSLPSANDSGDFTTQELADVFNEAVEEQEKNNVESQV